LTFGALAHHVKLPLKGVFVGEGPAPYKDLLDVRLRPSRHAANGGSKAGRIAPAEYRQSLLANDALQNPFALQALVFLHRQECHAHAIGAGRRQFETQLAALAHEELVWDLEENAGAISGFGIASACPAVRQVEQHLDSLAYDLVAFVAANVGHESDPACVVLLRRMVQSLGGRKAVRFLASRFFQTRRHGHHSQRTRPLPDRLFLSGDFARQGNGGVAHLGSGTKLCNLLVTVIWAEKYNSEFRCKGCKFPNLAVSGRSQANFPRDLRRPL